MDSWLLTFRRGQNRRSPKSSSREGSSVNDARRRMETPRAMAIPTSLNIGTFTAAKTTYATTTVIPAVSTAWPAHLTEVATLSSFDLPFVLSSFILRS